MSGPVRILSIGPDGSCTLEDGRDMHLAVSASGTLGVVPAAKQSQSQAKPADLSYDQAPGRPARAPTMAELGLDQI